MSAKLYSGTEKCSNKNEKEKHVIGSVITQMTGESLKLNIDQQKSFNPHNKKEYIFTKRTELKNLLGSIIGVPVERVRVEKLFK